LQAQAKVPGFVPGCFSGLKNRPVQGMDNSGHDRSPHTQKNYFSTKGMM
jgi:hypothetical protein